MSGLLLFFISIYFLFFDQGKNYKIGCSKKKLAEEVLRWCVLHMYKGNNRSTPEIKVLYNRNKTKYGEYCSAKNLISVCFPKDCDVLDVVSTIIHEYQHFIDIKNEKELRSYYRLNDALGYKNNPYEIRARKAEEQFAEVCVDYLKCKKVLLPSGFFN